MSWIDILILIILVGGLAEGALRGFIKSVVGVVSTAVGIYFARLFGEDGASLLCELWDMHPMVAEALACAIIFVVISFAVSLLSRLMGELVKAAHLSGMNRLLGAAVGLCKGALAVLIIVFALGRICEAKPTLAETARTESLLFSPTYRLANACLSVTRSQFGQSGTDDAERD
ncbi:MAG: CvpA family protein [Paludibacteraceae bacterium]|nr:CvpA family protein [Paludibacteraceae bacterium]